MRVRSTAALSLAILLLTLASWPHAQGTAPATPLTFLSSEKRGPVPTTVIGGQEFVTTNDLQSLFKVKAKENRKAGGIVITYKRRTVVVSTAQPVASVEGRTVTLSAAAVKVGRRWLVPVDALPLALGPIYDARIELRRPSRLLLVGAVRVPRVTAHLDAAGPPTRAVLDITPAATVTTSFESDRIVVRVDADALDLALPTAGGGLIDQFRAGDQPTRIAIVLSPRSGTSRATTTTADNITHVAIEVAPATPVELPSAPLSAATAQAPPAQAPGAAGGGTAASPSRPAGPTVVLDPGHGGTDEGARGEGGALEKTLTLDVARRLKTLIETRLGLRVVMTRDEDAAVTLDERSAIANRARAELFVSLHMNASVSHATRGAEVYVLRLDKEGEEARRRAAADEVTLSVIGGGSRSIEMVPWTLAQARHADASAALAGMVAEQFQQHGALGPRGVQQAPLRVLTGVNMPAVLLDLAYLTNPAQAALAMSADYQTLLAQGIADAIARFRTSRTQEHTP